jgi:arylsulfatase A-like enzyme
MFPGARRDRESGTPLSYVLPLVVAAVLFAGLRLIVLFTPPAGFEWSEVVHSARADPAVLISIWQAFAYSLSFEVAAILVVFGLALLGGAGRWVARGFFLALLWANLLGLAVFQVFGTYVQGAQLGGLTVADMRDMMRGRFDWKVWLIIVLTLMLAASLARGTGQGRPPRRTVVMLALLAVLSSVGASRLFLNPLAFPSTSHSPITLLLGMALPTSLTDVPSGAPTPDDWAPVSVPAPAWRALTEAPHAFNVVVLVLESVRAQTFWPAPEAPPMPHLEQLRSQSAVFSRAYVHEAQSVKSFEALILGTYPESGWEALTSHHADIGLDSLPERWSRRGLRTFFIQHWTMDFMGHADLLRNRGVTEMMGRDEIARIDPRGDDRTLVRALDGFLEKDPAKPFAGVIWVGQTHLPYVLPPPLKNTEPLASLGAYRETIAYEDLVIGDLEALLARRGLTDNTVVILVGDHGQSFNEHPESGLGHGRWQFEETSHVPLVFLNPKVFHGEHDDRLVQLKDLAATAAWLGGDERSNLNLGACVFYEKKSEAAYMLNAFAGMAGAMVSERWKYHYERAIGVPKADERLYDLVADPLEKTNLTSREPAKTTELRGRYFGWLGVWNQRWRTALSGPYRDRAFVERALLGATRPAP